MKQNTLFCSLACLVGMYDHSTCKNAQASREGVEGVDLSLSSHNVRVNVQDWGHFSLSDSFPGGHLKKSRGFTLGET